VLVAVAQDKAGQIARVDTGRALGEVLGRDGDEQYRRCREGRGGAENATDPDRLR
jgi:hypothetical protein